MPSEDKYQSKVSYTFTPVNNKAVPLLRGDTALGDFPEIEIQVIGKNNTSNVFSGGNKTVSGGIHAYTLVETAPNTGIFESKIGVKDLANAFGYPIKVGLMIKLFL